MKIETPVKILLLIAFAVPFALSSCDTVGIETPSPALSGYTLTYDIAIEANADVNSSPVWTPPLDKPGDVTYSFPTNAPLPKGLTLDPKTGVIRGTLTAVLAPTDYAVTATATTPGAYSGTVTGTVSITVTSNNLSANRFSYPHITDTLGTNIPEAEGIAPVWTIELTFPADVRYSIPEASPLPEGLNLDSKTGAIWGTLTKLLAKQTYTVTATATETGEYTGKATGTISIAINAIPLDSTYGFTYPPIIAAANTAIPATEVIAPTWTGELAFPSDVTYTSKNLPEGLVLNPDTGVISGSPTNPAKTQDYTITAEAKDGGVYAGEVSGTINIIVLHSYNLDDYDFKYDSAEITAAMNSPVTISPKWSPELELLDAVSYSIENADGSPLSLPPGLTFGGTTGIISGTPTGEAPKRDYRITVEPRDERAYTGKATFNISITTVAPNDISGYTLSYPHPAEIQNKIEGVVDRSLTVTPTWGTTIDYPTNIRYEIDETLNSLPKGLALNTGTGAIEGKPTTVADAQTYLITAIGSGFYEGKKTVSVSITIFATNDIGGPDYSLTYPSTTTPVGSPVTIAATWAPVLPSTVTYTASSELPTGLSFNTDTGAITGTPAAAAEAKTYTVTASASGSHIGTLTTNEFTITISPIALADKDRSFSYDDISIEVDKQIGEDEFLPQWTQELEYSSNVSYSIEPALTSATSGLSFNTDTGAITGKPTTAAEAKTYIVTATGSGNHAGELGARFSITITAIDISTTDVNTNNTLSYANIEGAVGKAIDEVAPTWGTKPAYPGDVSYEIAPPLNKATTGLSFNTQTGRITGEPTAVLTLTHYTVTATGTGNHRGTLASTQFTIILRMDISAAPPTLRYPDITAEGGKELADVHPVWDPQLDVPTQVSYKITDETTGSLPAGLELDTTTGVIRGMPEVTVVPAKDYSITVTGLGLYTGTRKVTVNITITMDISAAPPTLRYPDITAETYKKITDVHPVWDPQLEVPTQVSYKITDETTGSLPAGLSLNTDTGVISGTPEVTVVPAKPYSITVTGLGLYTGTREVTVNITITTDLSTPPPTLSYPDITAETYKKITDVHPVWDPQLEVPTQVRYEITQTTDSLPTGLSLNTDTGVISGTPEVTVVPAKDYSITVTGSAPYTGTRTVTINITVSPADIATYTFTYPLATGTLDDISAAPAWGINPAPTVRYEISSTLPAGLNFDSSTGTIEGTFAGLTHSTVYTVTATAASDTYTGSTSAIFLDTLVLPTAYTPTTAESTAISTREQLENMTASGTYHLTNHIDLGPEPAADPGSTNHYWTPIPTFTGILDGNGYAIYNLTIEGDTANYQGLFAALGDANSGATIKNLGIGVTRITGGAAIGALAGHASGTLTNITSTVMSTPESGTAITASGTASFSGSDGSYTGGLVGYLDSGSTLTGNNIGISISAAGSRVGGLVGYSSFTTIHGYATGDVSGSETVGGLVGDNWGPATGYATGSVTSSGNNVGGLVGENNGTVIGYATGAVTSSGNNVGGLVGLNDSTVIGYAAGDASGNHFVGGLVGANSTFGTATGYATGLVTGASWVGGLAGDNNGTITGYWDQASTEQNAGVGGTGTLTGGSRISATQNIVYTGSSYTVDGTAIFTATAFENAFDLTGPAAASKTWPKLLTNLSFTTIDWQGVATEHTVDFTLPQPTISDKDGQNGEGDGTIEIVWPSQN